MTGSTPLALWTTPSTLKGQTDMTTLIPTSIASAALDALAEKIARALDAAAEPLLDPTCGYHLEQFDSIDADRYETWRFEDDAAAELNLPRSYPPAKLAPLYVHYATLEGILYPEALEQRLELDEGLAGAIAHWHGLAIAGTRQGDLPVADCTW